MLMVGDLVFYMGKAATIVGFYKAIAGEGAYIRFFNQEAVRGVLLKDLKIM